MSCATVSRLSRLGFGLLLASLFATAPAWAADAAPAIARGDAAWARRAEGAKGGRAARAPIGEAVGAYEEALKADPASLEAAWKLLRALWFEGEYATADKEGKQRVFGRGKEVSEKAWAQVARRLGPGKVDAKTAAARATALRAVPEASPLLLWSAANWGLWGDAFGKLAAARQGVGEKVRDWCETLIVLDERFEDAAGHRVLGRLHTEAPKVPFFTGWVDHGKAVAELEKAVALSPAFLPNKVYLADALLRFEPKSRQRALAMLREVTAAQPRPELAVEDAGSIADATQLLATATKK